MILADKKKKENISEYIIHMYQTEDLLRAYHFDMEEVKEYVLKHIKNASQEELYLWYKGIADRMKEEGIEERGHLKSTQDIVKQISNLHETLLKADQQYRHIYSKAAVHIHHTIEESGGKIKDPVQAAFNGIYGYLLLKINDQKLDESLMPAVNAFGDLLSYLSYRWRESKY